jgi:hypothetical protein
MFLLDLGSILAVLKRDLAPGAQAVLDSAVMRSSGSIFFISPGFSRPLGLLALLLRR